jgi:hypothetical protein
MGKFEDKTNNEILLDVKQLQAEHESLKLSMVKDYDTIDAIKIKMKKEWIRLEVVEADFNEANAIILRRLKGEI